jgi:hypothetical protein
LPLKQELDEAEIGRFIGQALGADQSQGWQIRAGGHEDYLLPSATSKLAEGVRSELRSHNSAHMQMYPC